MHALDLAVHLVQDFPAVCAELVLRSDGQVPAALLECAAIGLSALPGVVPLLKVVEQIAGQPVAPGPGALLLMRGSGAAPSSAWGGSFFLLPGQYPPDTVRAVIPVDEHPSRFGHIARS